MENATTAVRRARGGWKDEEEKMLWEAADEAQLSGIPLKHVFEQVAMKTGRKPNSIRNYYYGQVHKRPGEVKYPARFVAFGEDEVRALMKKVLAARGAGRSVRSCVTEMAQGDHSLMLRYQNKYRSTLKNRPELVEEILRELKAEGVPVSKPVIHARSRSGPGPAEQVAEKAATLENEDISQMCRVLSELIVQAEAGRAGRKKQLELAGERDRISVRYDLLRMEMTETQKRMEQVVCACNDILLCVKGYLGKEDEQRRLEWDAFCHRLLEHTAVLDSAVSQAAYQ